MRTGADPSGPLVIVKPHLTMTPATIRKMNTQQDSYDPLQSQYDPTDDNTTNKQNGSS